MAREWSAAEVAAWLVQTGFGEDLAATFKDNDIDGAILLDDLTESDLQSSLNVVSLGKRRKLLRAIQHLRGTHTTSPPPSASQPSRDASPVAMPLLQQEPPPPPPQPPQPPKMQRVNSSTPGPSSAISATPVWKFEQVDLPALFATRSLGRRGQSNDNDDEHVDFAFTAAPVFRSNADRLKQRMMKRLFRQSHVTHVDDDDTGRLRGKGLEAIWIPPLPRHANSAAVRIFHRTARGITDRLDNTGTYGNLFADPTPIRVAASRRATSNAKQPVLVGSGFEKKVVGGYNCKRKRTAKASHADEDDDDDPELPPYGESDISDYYFDSEWEEELKEHEPYQVLEDKEGGAGDANPSSRKPKPAQAASGTQPDDDDDLDNFSRSGKSWAQTRKSRKEYTGRFKRRRINNSAAAETALRPNRFLAADTIRAIVEDNIGVFKERWRAKTLPKFEAEAYRIYKEERHHLESLQATRDDLQTRRLSDLIDKIVSVKTCSEKEVRALSASCETTVQHICELEWLIELVQGPKPPKPKKGEKKKKKKKPKTAEEEPPKPKKAAPRYEPDQWSDFIASEDDYAPKEASVDLSVDMQSSDSDGADNHGPSTKDAKSPRRGPSLQANAAADMERRPLPEGHSPRKKAGGVDHDEQKDHNPVVVIESEEQETDSDADRIFAAEQTHISSANATPRQRTASTEDWDFDETVLMEFQVIPDQRKAHLSPQNAKLAPPLPTDTPKPKRKPLHASSSPPTKVARPSVSSASNSHVIVINSDEDTVPLRPQSAGMIGPQKRLRKMAKKEPKSELSEVEAQRRKLDAYFLQWSHEPIENLLHEIDLFKRWPYTGQAPPNPLLACLIQEFNFFVLKTATKPAQEMTFRERTTVGYDERRALQLRGYIQWRAGQTMGTDISEKDVVDEAPAIFVDAGKKPAKKAIKNRSFYDDWSSDDEVKGRPPTLKERLKPKVRSRVHVIRSSSDKSDVDEDAPALQDRRSGRRDIQKIRPESEAAVRKRNERERQDQIIRKRAEKQATEKTSSLIVNLGHDESEQHIFLAGFLEPHLKPHQVDGLRFLWKNIIMVKQPGGAHAGCILAHAMGLGKTLQTIAFIYTLMTEIAKNNPAIPEHLRPGRILVVAPVSVLVNWHAEFMKWIPPAHRDPLKEVAVLNSAASEGRANAIQRWHNRGGILVAGYEMMVLMRKLYPTENQSIVEASLLICDEGHLIKNTVTQRTVALSCMQTPSRILLTGTPLQNHLTEYWCMINFACNDFLGSLPDFRNAYENPIRNGFCLDSTDGDKKLARSRMFVLCKLIEPIVQRMDTAPLKAELPLKTEFTIICKLTAVQQAAYTEVITNMMGVLGTLPGVIRLCGHPGVFKEEIDKKMDINHEKLIGKHASSANAASPTVVTMIDDDGAEEAVIPLTNNELEEELALLNKSRPSFDAIFENIDDPFVEELSVKVKMAIAIVKAARELGEKVLAFSTSIPVLHYLLNRFTAHKIAAVLMEGATTQAKRQKLIHNFGADEATVFLISTKTGSVGINLQAATRVVVFDIGWNPTDAEQAIARAYRYGQTRPVTVYRLITYGTFEETLYKINIHKSKLSKRVVDKINTSKDFTKLEMRDWSTIPADPEQIEWELTPDEEAQIAAQDSILAHILLPAPDTENDRLTVNKYIDLAAIRRHDHKFAEVDNEMDESERAQSLLLYEQERNRRKSGLRLGLEQLASATTAAAIEVTLASTEGDGGIAAAAAAVIPTTAGAVLLENGATVAEDEVTLSSTEGDEAVAAARVVIPTMAGAVSKPMMDVDGMQPPQPPSLPSRLPALDAATPVIDPTSPISQQQPDVIPPNPSTPAKSRRAPRRPQCATSSRNVPPPQPVISPRGLHQPAVPSSVPFPKWVLDSQAALMRAYPDDRITVVRRPGNFCMLCLDCAGKPNISSSVH
ncbi:hypothetical protein HDU86_007288 [Geranomyces michiganensis]|nr:hypothetical protein HDU86_007288 [Geranomyces michiganensis]